MSKLKYRLERLEKRCSTLSGEFKYTEEDWSFEERLLYIESPTPELEEKDRLTDWTIRRGPKKLEEYFM